MNFGMNCWGVQVSEGTHEQQQQTAAAATTTAVPTT
jgi:hypothetical protein